jgi:hypothetical protein
MPVGFRLDAEYDQIPACSLSICSPWIALETNGRKTTKVDANISQTATDLMRSKDISENGRTCGA